jgi:hypothetical protein
LLSNGFKPSDGGKTQARRGKIPPPGFIAFYGCKEILEETVSLKW